jgi:stage III sporulation protein AF
MSYISSWVISIVGIVIVSVLVEIILPEGNINKYIKGFLAIFTVFVMVKPIVNISAIDIIGESDYEISLDNTFLEEINETKAMHYALMTEGKLKQNGYDKIGVDICVDKQENQLKIMTIIVDLRKVVINNKNENIDIYNNIKNIIKSVVEIDSEDIIFNE